MIKQHKIDQVGDIMVKLKEKKNLFLTNYTGINVKNLSLLRKKLREKNADYKVVKNNLLKRALMESGYSKVDEFLKGPIGVAFVKDEVGEVAKILSDFKKEVEAFKYTAGIVDNVVYNSVDIDKIAKLPSREVILAQTMGMINAPATSIARGMNQIMASVARGIKAVAEANAAKA